MNRDNDDTFMSLLSNQRKLLMQIQQEISPNSAAGQQPQPSPSTRSNPNNFITSTTSGLPAASTQQYQVGNGLLSSLSAFQVANSSFQQPQLPLRYHHQQQSQSLNQNVSTMFPSSHAAILPPPLPFHPMATNRPIQRQQRPPSSFQNHQRNDSFLPDDHNDYLASAGSLEPTPFRMKRLSLGLATDNLNDLFVVEDAIKGAEKLGATNEKTHDHHSMHLEHSRLQVSQGLFDMDSDSPGDSSFSNIFQDSKPRQDKKGIKDNTNRQDKKKNPPPPPAVRKDLSGGLTKKTTKKRRREEYTKEYMSIPNDIIIDDKNRKINSDVQKFANALEKSAQSQQDIHQWDRKMGLKRSHSKTMTQSMQSRKKLRGILYSISDTIDHQKKEPSL